ncbi:MAG: DUF882 domain-containing protein [Thermodesulfobacteriota bacterium]
MSQYKIKVCRRSFLKTLFISGIFAFIPKMSFASNKTNDHGVRWLNLYHPKTKESFKTEYWIRGEYIRNALSDINYIMRDQRTGEVAHMDKNLLDLLFSIHTGLGSSEPFHIMSGYRSPETNDLLRKKGWAIAKNSLHENGKAIDIRLPNTETSSLRRTAYKIKGGGVGYYPNLKFVHIDVGSIRYWTKY